MFHALDIGDRDALGPGRNLDGVGVCGVELDRPLEHASERWQVAIKQGGSIDELGQVGDPLNVLELFLHLDVALPGGDAFFQIGVDDPAVERRPGRSTITNKLRRIPVRSPRRVRSAKIGRLHPGSAGTARGRRVP